MNAKPSNSQTKAYEVTYEVVLRIRPAGREPIEMTFNGGNDYAMHPAHLRTFQLGFGEFVDNSVRNHCLIAMTLLLEEIAAEHQKSIEGDTKLTTPGRALQFGSPELESAMVAPESSMVESTTQKRAA